MEQNPQLQTTPFAVGGGVMNESFAIHIGGSQSGPVYAVAPVGNRNNASSLNFHSKYISNYSGQPTVYSASAYDCTNIVINAIQNVINGTLSGISAMTPPTGPNNRATANSFRQEVIKAIQQTSYDGITDHYTFDGNGDTINQTVSIYQLDMNSQHWNYIPPA